VASGIVMLGSLSVFLGWAGDYEPFKNLTSGGETTKPLGALGLFFAGAALFLSRREQGATEPWRRFLGVACAGVPLLVGGLTLLEQGLDFDLGIHRVLFPQALMAEGPFAGRPVFPISLCLVLLGLALVTIHSRAIRLGALVLVALFLGLLVLIGYLYHAVPFYRVEAQRPVPVIAALLVVTTALGYLSARPESAMLDAVTSHLAGGAAARRLLPAAILLPLGLGLLRLIGQRMGLYGMEFGLALFATLNMTVFVALVYSSARRLNQADAKREAAHGALLESEESFRRLLDATPAGLIIVDADGRIAMANATAERLFGYDAGRLAGQRIEALVPERFRARHAALRHGFSAGEGPRLGGAGRDLVGLRQDGAEFPVEIGLSPVEMPNGSFALASVTDITERKRAEDEIRSLNATLERRVAERTRQLDFERARWRGIVEGIADEVWMCDARGRMSLLNLPGLIGMEQDAPRDKSVEEIHQTLDVFSPDGQPRPPEQAPLLRSLRGEIVHGEEILRDRQTGRERHRQFSSAPMRDAGGAITGAVAIVRDVTDHKRAEEGLRRFELLASHGKDIVLFMRRDDGRILEANAAAVRAYGYRRDELLALTIEDLRAPETRGLTADQMAQADAAGILFETIHRRTDGTTFPVEVSSQGASIGGMRTLISIVRDITERERAEGALRRSEQRLNRAQEIAHLGSWELDLADDTLTWSDEAYRIFGLEPQEFGATYAAFLDAVHPEDRAAVDAAYSSSIREGRDTYEIEHRIVRRPDGEVRFVHEKCEHFRDEAGRIVRSVGMVHDITERERTQAEIRELARRHRLALDAAGMGWWHYDPLTQVATWDDRFREIFGVPGHSRPNDQVLARIHPDDRPGVRARVEAALDPSKRQPYAAEYRISLPDGTMKWIEAQGVASFEGTGGERRASSLVGTVADITERKRAQAQLSAALQHKEALLKEIHHRVKNNLQVISSLLRLQSAALHDPHLRELFTDSQRRVRAMALIHEQLYQSPDLARIDFESYVLNLVNYLRRSLTPASSNVEIRVSIENVLLGMDQAMPLGLLVSELVSNSLKHAFPSGGDAPAGEISIVARREPPGGLTLTVGDNGVGLPDEVDLEHPPSMGLQLVRSFVDQLQGELAVRRKHGTVLTVTIPEKRD